MNSDGIVNSSGISKSMEYLRKVRMRKALILSLRLFLLAAVFILWELAARLKLIDPFIMSQPSRIADTIVRLYREGKLFYHTGITSARNSDRIPSRNAGRHADSRSALVVRFCPGYLNLTLSFSTVFPR